MIPTKSCERRVSHRRTRAECPWLTSARLRAGRDIRLLDLSTGGALIEGAARLLPGASIVLHLIGPDRRHTLRATVHRCHVSALDRVTGIRYRAALVFDHCFHFPDDSGELVHALGTQSDCLLVVSHRVAGSRYEAGGSMTAGS